MIDVRNFFTRFFALLLPPAIEGRQTTDPVPEAVRIVARALTTAGTRIDPDRAMRSAAVWACVSYLARTTAQLPWRVYRERPDGSSEKAFSHPIDYLVHKRPNAAMGSFRFRELMVGWACRWGNAVAEIVRDRRGMVIGLWPIHPSRLTYEIGDDGTVVFVVSDPAGGPRYLASSDVFHIAGFGEGPVGLNVVAYAAESIGWSQATELFGSSWFGGGANPSLVIKFPKDMKLSKDAKKSYRDQFDAIYAGPRGEKIVLADEGIDVSPLPINMRDAQFVDTRYQQVEEICRWFGVPPHKVAHLLRATFANIEHQSIEVVTDSITPWCKRFEEEADFKLFGANRAGFFTKLELKGLMRGDFLSRQQGLQIQRRNGIISANDWARLEDYDEIGKAGDVHIVEGNMMPLDAFLEPLAPPPAPAATPQPNAPGPGGSATDQSAIARARAQLRRVHNAGFHEDQRRDDHGRWTEEGGDGVDYDATSPVIHTEDAEQWGAAHSNSQAITGASAEEMGLDGYERGYRPTQGDNWPANVADSMLTYIEDSAGSREPLYHGFQNTNGTRFTPGDTIRLPLLAATGDLRDAASYGIRRHAEDQKGPPTVFEFPKGTKFAGYARWDRQQAKTFGHTWAEAIVAGGFRVASTRDYETDYTVLGKDKAYLAHVTIVRLEPVEYYSVKNHSWARYG